MDRLICGDVGFGKTEVALRAAFIAAMDGTQVAVVVPTTLAGAPALPHLRGALRRLAGAGRAALAPGLGRATRRDQEATSPTAASTSSSARMRSSARSITFRHLGLLVIDEEQHFGVAQKERLKQLKAQCPRADADRDADPAHAAAGARRRARDEHHRDAAGRSPGGAHLRHAATTRWWCARRSCASAIAAASASMSRRASAISTRCARNCSELVPEIKIAVAHGKMAPTELEAVMTAFDDGSLRHAALDQHHRDPASTSRPPTPSSSTAPTCSACRSSTSCAAASAAASCAPMPISPCRRARRSDRHGAAPARGDADTRSAGRRLHAGEPRSRHPRRRQSSGRGAVGTHPRGRRRALPAHAGGGDRRVARAATRAGEAKDEWTPQITIGTPVLIPESYVGDLNVRLGLYRRIAALVDRREIDAFAAELIDRFGAAAAGGRQPARDHRHQAALPRRRGREGRGRSQGRGHRLPPGPFRQSRRACGLSAGAGRHRQAAPGPAPRRHAQLGRRRATASAASTRCCAASPKSPPRRWPRRPSRSAPARDNSIARGGRRGPFAEIPANIDPAARAPYLRAIMTDRLSIAIAQLDPTVGDIAGNLAKLRTARDEAARLGADLVVASELYRRGLSARGSGAEAGLHRGLPGGGARLRARDRVGTGGTLRHAVAAGRQALQRRGARSIGGEIAALRFKYDLPNYGVFDEKRVFSAGPCPGPIPFRGVRLGVLVCEDMWSVDATETLSESGAELLVVINGSPFESDKRDERISLPSPASRRAACRCSMSTRSAARTNWCSTAPPSRSTPRASSRLQAPCWHEALVMSHWQRQADGLWTVEPGTLDAAVRGDRRGLSRARPRPARLCPQEPLSWRRARALGRHRFGADRRARGRCAGRRSGPLRDDAVALHLARQSRGCGRGRPELLGAELRSIDIGPAMRAFADDAGAVLRRTRARHHRGEHPVARPRRRADGALQQVRLDGALDRQQVGDVGRLCHALRRHVRRLRGAEGRLQDDRVRALALAQRASPAGLPRPLRPRSCPSASSRSRRAPN